MKRLKYLFFLPASIVLVLVSCAKSGDTPDPTDSSGNWLKRSEFEGNARTEAVAFTIGDTSYIGTGFDGTNRYKDFWAYDPVKNFWIQRAQFPGTARNSAVGFSVGTKGYISTGYDGINRLSDTWEYNQATNAWVQKADFAGSARYDAVGFGINDKGYITTGFDGGYTKDLWEFNPTAGTSGTWTQKVSLGGSKRSGAVVFVYNNKAYVVTGTNNGTLVTDFWVYDPSAAAWTQLRDITNSSTDTYDDDYSDIARGNGVAFIINGKGYISCGESATSGYTRKTWEYDFSADSWARKTTYERSDRSGAVAFSVKGRGFVACGKGSSLPFDDIDEFQPDVTYNAND